MSPRVPQIAARALVATTVVLAVVIAGVAFMAGTEVRSASEFQVRQAGGILVAVLAIATVVPGLFVWITPTPRLLWVWTATALLCSLAFYALFDHFHSPQAKVAWRPVPTVAAAVWVLTTTSVLGSYIAGFAVEASGPRHAGEGPELAARLRRLVVALSALAIVLLGVGLLPGQRVYYDANHCLDSALGSLFHTQRRHIACASSYTELFGTYVAGGGPRLALYLVVVLVPIWPLYRDPRARRAWQWFGAAIAGSVVACNLMCYLELEPDALSHTMTLWPTRIVEAGVATIQVMLLLGLPLMIARSRAPRVPIARVVRRE